MKVSRDRRVWPLRRRSCDGRPPDARLRTPAFPRLRCPPFSSLTQPEIAKSGQPPSLVEVPDGAMTCENQLRPTSFRHYCIALSICTSSLICPLPRSNPALHGRSSVAGPPSATSTLCTSILDLLFRPSWIPFLFNPFPSPPYQITLSVPSIAHLKSSPTPLRSCFTNSCMPAGLVRTSRVKLVNTCSR